MFVCDIGNFLYMTLLKMIVSLMSLNNQDIFYRAQPLVISPSFLSTQQLRILSTSAQLIEIYGLIEISHMKQLKWQSGYKRVQQIATILASVYWAFTMWQSLFWVLSSLTAQSCGSKVAMRPLGPHSPPHPSAYFINLDHHLFRIWK